MADLKKIFSYEPKESLYRAILARIDREKIKKTRQRFIFFTLSSIFSFGASLTALWYIIGQLSQSEFAYYFSLVFSDSRVILTYWKEFGIVLAESLPVLGLFLLLAGICATLISVKNMAQNFTPSPKIVYPA